MQSTAYQGEDKQSISFLCEWKTCTSHFKKICPVFYVCVFIGSKEFCKESAKMFVCTCELWEEFVTQPNYASAEKWHGTVNTKGQ